MRAHSFAATAVATLSLACAVAATEPVAPVAAPVATLPSQAEPDAAYGARLFGVYCQSCHGKHGRGDGPVARELDLGLADLRRLAARSPDGKFPADRTADVIDGRVPVAGHGTRDMPVWGLTFLDPGRVAEQESDVEERIRSLVAFLRSIQEER
ncbi:MAG TPA: c-type cytochrome [Thermoanaerobaculia bacterium]|nr:c-type cytochrome [Thermoanaerobaculia bacterium]